MLQRLAAQGAQLVEVLPRAEFEEEHCECRDKSGTVAAVMSG